LEGVISVTITAPKGTSSAAERVAPPLETSLTDHGLKKNALGFPTAMAQSIGVISPTMTAVLIIPLAFSNAGRGTWLAYAFGTVMLFFVVLCLNQFARRSAYPGSMYAYTGKGLGPKFGVFSGWTLLWSYMFIGVAGLCGFEIFCNQFLNALGMHGALPAVPFFALSAATCWFVAYKDIRISSLLMMTLEGASVAVILALAGVVLFKHGFTVDTSQVTLKGVSLHGMSLAVVACIFSLVGFESATAVGGEVRNPLKNIPKAVVWSLVLTGTFMTIMAYVEVFGTRHYGTSLADLSAPLNTLASIYQVSFFKAPISLCAMVSFFSLTLSCLNAGARIIYPMGRHSVFPSLLGRSHKLNRTPHVAISAYVLMIFTFPCVLALFTNSLTTFDDAGTLAAFGFLLAYFLISAAAPAYLRRRGEIRPRNVVITVIAFLCLLVPTIGSFYPVPPFPVNVFPYIFLAYMTVGGVWLYVANRKRAGLLLAIEKDLEQSAKVFDVAEGADEVASATAPSETPVRATVAIAEPVPAGLRD
jgi:amino acid transporter